MQSRSAPNDAGRDRPFADLFLSPLAEGEQLRVGVVVGHSRLTNAAASIASDVRRCAFADVALVLQRDGADRRRVSGGRAAWRLYAAADRRRMRSRPDPDAPAPGPSPLVGVPSIRLPGLEDGPGSMDPGTLAAIRAARLDVLLDLGTGDLPADLVAIPRFGVWRLGPAGTGDGGPAFLARMRRRVPTIAVDLTCRTSAAEDLLVLARVVVATDLTSHARNRAHAVFGATHLVVRTLRRLHDGGWPALEDDLVDRVPAPPPSSPADDPDTVAVLRWLLPLTIERGLARAGRIVARDRSEHWRIAIRDPARPMLPGDGAIDLSGFRWTEPPAGHFHADPFVVQDAGRTWLFFEDYVSRWRKGVIACAEVRDGALVGRLRTVRVAGGHLSYPCVFAHEGAWYMIPESAAERKVRLLRAATFPWAWEEVAVLHEGRAVDTTVWRQDGRWWFFTTLREPRANAMMLALFHAEALDGPWIAHPANPIGSDVRRVRGAGAIRILDGRLIRPSQDGSETYGRSITFNEIVRLTPTEYLERPIGGLDPGAGRGLTGIHTYNRAGTVEVIDGKRERRAWRPPRRPAIRRPNACTSRPPADQPRRGDP